MALDERLSVDLEKGGVRSVPLDLPLKENT